MKMELLLWIISLLCTSTLSIPYGNIQKRIYYPAKRQQSSFGAKSSVSIPQTNLFSEVYYRLTMLRYPKGVVSLTNQTDSNGAYLLQIDYDPDNRELYLEGGEREFQDQWKLIPSGER